MSLWKRARSINKIYLSYNHIFFFSDTLNKYFVVDKSNKKKYTINKNVYDVLKLCNGRYTREEIIATFDECQKSQIIGLLDYLFEKGIITTQDYRKLFHDKCFVNGVPYFDNIYINVISRCNLRCPFCSAGKVTEKDYMSLNDYEKIAGEIEKIYNKELPVICFTGGEPLLNKDFIKIVEIFYKKHFKLCLLTNGTLINDSNCDFLKMFNDIAISLDSTNRSQHEKFRGNINRCFDKTLSALKLLSKKNYSNIWIQTAVAKENLNQMPKIAELADDLNLYGIRYSIIHPLGKGEDDCTVQLSSDEIGEYYANIISLKKKYPSLKFNESLSLNKPNNFEAANSCCRLHSSCLINHDGTMSLCPGFLKETDFTKSKLVDTPFLKVAMESSLIKYYKSNIIEDINKCGDCGIRHFCFGGCQAEKEICTPKKKDGIVKCLEKILI